MSAFLITYDLNRPGQDYKRLVEAIESYGTYWHFMQNAWVIRSSSSASQVRDYLQQYIDANDKLFIARLGETAWAGFDTNGNTWLKTQISSGVASLDL